MSRRKLFAEQLAIRLTKAQRAKLDTAARRTGQVLSEFVRSTSGAAADFVNEPPPTIYVERTLEAGEA
jgi:uncharacterized protein (DUF1778 family)